MVRARRNTVSNTTAVCPAAHLVVMEHHRSVIVARLFWHVKFDILLRLSLITWRQSCATAPGYGWHPPGPTPGDKSGGEGRSNAPRSKLREGIATIPRTVLSVHYLSTRVHTLPQNKVDYG